LVTASEHVATTSAVRNTREELGPSRTASAKVANDMLSQGRQSESDPDAISC